MTEVKPEQPAEDGPAVVGENIETRATETQPSDCDSGIAIPAEDSEALLPGSEAPAPSNGELAELLSSQEEGANGILSLHEPETDSEAALDIPAEEASQDAETEKPQGFFRRRGQNQELKKLKAENEKLAEEAAVYRDRYLRLAAEMENFRKRTDRDFYARVQAEVARTLFAFLPLMDDLERCLHVKDEARDYEALLEGVRLIQQNFAKVLSDHDVAPMNAAGKEFDPNFHEALTELASEGTPPGLVLEEHVKGYVLREKVLRPAKVIVSK
jgi:molecular chaperone GrpE